MVPLTLFFCGIFASNIITKLYYMTNPVLCNKFYSAMLTIIFLSFVPLIYIQKLYSWIPSMFFAALTIFMLFLDDWQLCELTHPDIINIYSLARMLMYFSMLPNLMRYNLYVITVYFLLTTVLIGAEIAYYNTTGE